MISVIIPVYNQAELTANCIESVLNARVDQDFRLIVIDDGSTDRKVENIISKFGSDPRVEVVRNSENLGFTRTANKGMALASRDSHPLLLNSDTIVYDYWLDAMNSCLLSDPKVATVTPLTNQRGSHISCYPHPFWSDTEFSELDDQVLAALAYRHCRGAMIEVHTGVGFCMLINRDAIDAIGLFDAVHFPRGYGEESDFCYRARGVGWRHLVCGGTFVTHLHAQSFGSEKTRLRSAMLATFRRLHPSQPATDFAYRRNDPVGVVRRQLDFGRLNAIVDTQMQSRIISVYRAGEAPPEPIWLEASSDTTAFRVNGSEIGVPNVGSYKLPTDIVRLLTDLSRMNVSKLRFVGQPVMAKNCFELTKSMRMHMQMEETAGTASLLW